MEQVPSSASKRPRTSTSPPPDKKRRVSNDSTDNTLRIVTEILREENRQLLRDREGLEQDKTTLSERLAQAQRSLRDLKDDVAHFYRQKQEEVNAQRRAFEQKLQESAQGQESKDIRGTVAYSQETTKEIDRFLQSSELWYKKLVVMSDTLRAQTEKVETQEVQGVVRDLVTNVEMKTIRNELKTQHEMLLCLSNWRYEDEVACLKKSQRDRQETEMLEAIEKQLMNDRVVELETQLAQKRAVIKEKEMELSLLRADQEKLMKSSRVVPNEEFETLVAEKKTVEDELKQSKVEMKKQAESAKEECVSLKQQNEKLLEETQQLREKQKSDFEGTKTQNEEVKKLQEQVQAGKIREAKMAVALKSAAKVMEKNKERKEELKILYAKFSSTMDTVSEKTMRLEELEQEMEEARVVQVAEKEALQIFIQQYYVAAEEKCSRLLEKVRELEE